MHMHKISVSSETGSSPFFFSSFYYYCTHERPYETFEPVANCLPHEPSIRFVLCRKKTSRVRTNHNDSWFQKGSALGTPGHADGTFSFAYR